MEKICPNRKDLGTLVKQSGLNVSSDGLLFTSLSEPYVLKQIPAAAAAAAAKSLQSCLTLCDPIDGRPPGSSVPGILQARTLEWVAISFSKHIPRNSN